MATLGEGSSATIYALPDDRHVLKVYQKKPTINWRLQTALQEIDPLQLRYIHYVRTMNPRIMMMKRLLPLDPLRLNRSQYRYLRKSVEFLGEHNLSHGDIPGNVMLDPVTLMPVLIDFDHGQVRASKDDKSMDYMAFMTHAKIGKATN